MLKKRIEEFKNINFLKWTEKREVKMYDEFIEESDEEDEFLRDIDDLELDE